MKVLFVGGVHGVGKSTTCMIARDKYGFGLCRASDFLKQCSVTVADMSFEERQELIADKICETINNSKKNLLVIDGHFSMLLSEGEVRNVKVDIFKRLKLDHLVCLYDDPKNIFQRLHIRDGKSMSLECLVQLQNAEIEHAKQVALGCNAAIDFIHTADVKMFYEIVEELV